MKTFLFKISLFLALMIGVYSLFFLCVHRGIKSSEYGDFAEWNEIISGDINADYLVMGSSRAWRHVDPRILDTEIAENSYNLGIDGYHIPMQITKYNIYAKYNQDPKNVIYVLDHFSFDKRKDLFNRTQFLPYFDEEVLVERLKEYEGFEWEHYNIPFYQYSGSKEVCIAGFMEFLGLKDFKADKKKGFRSKNEKWETSFDYELKSNPDGKRAIVLDEVVNEFSDFIEEMRMNNTNVTLVYAPEYFEFQSFITNRDSVIQIYEDIAHTNNLRFIDFSTHAICREKKYFYNPTHMNTTGATIFSSDLCDSLKYLTDSE